MKNQKLITFLFIFITVLLILAGAPVILIGLTAVIPIVPIVVEMIGKKAVSLTSIKNELYTLKVESVSLLSIRDGLLAQIDLFMHLLASFSEASFVNYGKDYNEICAMVQDAHDDFLNNTSKAYAFIILHNKDTCFKSDEIITQYLQTNDEIVRRLQSMLVEFSSMNPTRSTQYINDMHDALQSIKRR